MRIEELKGYKSDPIYTAAVSTFEPTTGNGLKGSLRRDQINKFVNFMLANDFVPLGQGYYGTVFEKPGYPWVFKIYKDDAAYHTYINWAIKHPNNPNVPKFKGKPILIAPNTYVIRMEKFKPLGEYYKDLLNLLVKMSNTWEEIEDLDKDFSKEMYWLHKQFPGIAAIIEVIYNAWPDFILDIHVNNIMMRGNIPVLIDPVS